MGRLTGLEESLEGDRILVADDRESLAVLHELGDALAEEGERRVGDRPFQILHALGVRDSLVSASLLEVAWWSRAAVTATKVGALAFGCTLF